jgi:hypothetical protein
MGTYTNPMLQRELHSGPHQQKIAGMGTTGDVGTADEWHQPGIVGESFAQVTIYIY